MNFAVHGKCVEYRNKGKENKCVKRLGVVGGEVKIRHLLKRYQRGCIDE